VRGMSFRVDTGMAETNKSVTSSPYAAGPAPAHVASRNRTHGRTPKNRVAQVAAIQFGRAGRDVGFTIRARYISIIEDRSGNVNRMAVGPVDCSQPTLAEIDQW